MLNSDLIVQLATAKCACDYTLTIVFALHQQLPEQPALLYHSSTTQEHNQGYLVNLSIFLVVVVSCLFLWF
jgi:hypothetical protein